MGASCGRKRLLKIHSGSVWMPGPAVKVVITISSKDSPQLDNARRHQCRRMFGNTTCRKVNTRVAPRSMDASTMSPPIRRSRAVGGQPRGRDVPMARVAATETMPRWALRQRRHGGQQHSLVAVVRAAARSSSPGRLTAGVSGTGEVARVCGARGDSIDHPASLVAADVGEHPAIVLEAPVTSSSDPTAATERGPAHTRPSPPRVRSVRRSVHGQATHRARAPARRQITVALSNLTEDVRPMSASLRLTSARVRSHPRVRDRASSLGCGRT